MGGFVGDGAAVTSAVEPVAAPRWKGRVALVTGSSKGIGEAIAKRFGALGASVLVNSIRSVEEGRAVADSLPDGLYVQADVADEGECARLVETALDRWGRLDLLVNNAGAGPVIAHGDLPAATLDIWREVFSVNVFAPWALTVAAAPALAAVQGSIVNVTSIAGIREVGSSIPYACSKAATNHMTELAAKVLGPDVRVNAVAPGLVDTPRSASWDASKEAYRRMAPMRRTASANEVADAVVFLAETPFVTGEILVIDGGFRLVS
jgi:ketoreductase RED2